MGRKEEKGEEPGQGAWGTSFGVQNYQAENGERKRTAGDMMAEGGRDSGERRAQEDLGDERKIEPSPGCEQIKATQGTRRHDGAELKSSTRKTNGN